MRRAWLAPSLLLLVTPSCVHGSTTELYAARGTDDDSVRDPGEEPQQIREVVVGHDGDDGDEGDEPTPAQASRWPARGALPEPVFFHLGAGYGALGQVDLAPCRDQGLQRGYLRVRVTFHNSGRVVRAAVETPLPPPQEALMCIGEQLEMAMVPVFGGGDVTLSKSFFVN